MAVLDDHRVSIESENATETTLICTCGWKTTVAPIFVVPVMERHAYLTGLTTP